MDLPILPGVTDLLLRADWWLLDGPAGTVLSSPWSVYLAVPPVCVAAIAAGGALGASYDRLAAAARTGAVNAALTVSCLSPAHPVTAARPATHQEVSA